MLIDGQDAESALVEDDNVFSVHRYRPLQLHLRVGHLHFRNTLSRFSERRSETEHQTSTAVFIMQHGFIKFNVMSTYLYAVK